MNDDVPTFLPLGNDPLLVGRSTAAALVLCDPGISWRHATLGREGTEFRLEDHDSETGTFLNNRRIRMARALVGDRIRFGSLVTYRIEAAGLRLEASAAGVEVTVRQLGIEMGRRSPGQMLRATLRPWLNGGFATGTVEAHPILADVSFSCAPDAFVGILGPSGSGKSTLLKCLASYLPPTSGELQFDRRNAYEEIEELRAILGHVPQDDVVFRTLTVEENLRYAAQLRLSDNVEDVLQRTGLAPHRDKPVAVLSGGQRKRLSVGIELLRRPRLLLLDEPTSGLDPATEAALMEQLRILARQGTTVICTTHLMENIRLFDQVIVLGVFEGVGRLAYLGPPDRLLEHFQCGGFGELYKCLESGDFARVSFAFEDSSGNTLDKLPAQPTIQRDSSAQSFRPVPAPQLCSHEDLDRARHQASVIARRAIRIVTRDAGLLLGLAAQPIVLGMLVAISQYDADAQNRPFTVIFFAVVIAIWLGLNNSARELVRDRRHYVRERLAGLTPAAYLGAKFLVQAAIGALQIALLMIVLRFACQWTLEADGAKTFILSELPTSRFAFALLLSLFGGVGLGFLVSALAPTEESAVAALPMLIIPQLLLSAVGAGVHTDTLDTNGPARPLFMRPLEDGVEGRTPLTSQAVVLDVISAACISRPAAFVAQAPHANRSAWGWWADTGHLLALLLITWFMAVSAFLWAERRWLQLLGL
jgi:ABC-type multidrug transport system ATPase subunit